MLARRITVHLSAASSSLLMDAEAQCRAESDAAPDSASWLLPRDGKPVRPPVPIECPLADRLSSARQSPSRNEYTGSKSGCLSLAHLRTLIVAPARVTAMMIGRASSGTPGRSGTLSVTKMVCADEPLDLGPLLGREPDLVPLLHSPDCPAGGGPTTWTIAVRSSATQRA